jgi:hypothetical protein
MILSRRVVLHTDEETTIAAIRADLTNLQIDAGDPMRLGGRGE